MYKLKVAKTDMGMHVWCVRLNGMCIGAYDSWIEAYQFAFKYAKFIVNLNE